MDIISVVLSLIMIILSAAILWEFKTANWYAAQTQEFMVLKCFQKKKKDFRRPKQNPGNQNATN